MHSQKPTRGMTKLEAEEPPSEQPRTDLRKLRLIAAAVRTAIAIITNSSPPWVLILATVLLSLGLAAVVITAIVKLRHHPRFGRVTLIVAIAWIPVLGIIFLPSVVANAAGKATGTAYASIVGTPVGAVWFFGGIALFVTWFVTAVQAKPQVQGQAPQTRVAGWYPDPSGSGRMRWFDGVVWRDEYGDAPTP